VERKQPKNLTTFTIFKILPKGNNNPIGGKSPNLVTLIAVATCVKSRVATLKMFMAYFIIAHLFLKNVSVEFGKKF
jgi:hypothetical protein